MLKSLANLVVRRHRAALVLSLLVFLGLSVYGSTAFGSLSEGGQVAADAPSTQAENLLDQHFGGSPGLVVLITAKHGTVADPDVERVGERVTTKLKSQSYVGNVTSYFATPAAGLRSTDHRSALVLAHVEQDGDKPNKALPHLLDDLTSYGGDTATVQSGGETGTNVALTKQIGKDLAIVSIVAVPITVILLYFVFGGLLAALLPLGMAAFAMMGTFAELKLLTTFTNVSTYAIDLNIALGLGLAVDYGLLIITRYREEVSQGWALPDAISRAINTAGRTVLFSAITVALSMTALLALPGLLPQVVRLRRHRGRRLRCPLSPSHPARHARRPRRSRRHPPEPTARTEAPEGAGPACRRRCRRSLGRRRPRRRRRHPAARSGLESRRPSPAARCFSQHPSSSSLS